MQAVRLYAHYTTASIRAQLQYPGSFFMMALAQFAGTVDFQLSRIGVLTF